MEMKYLTEQDTGNIYLPAVHVTGIVGLDTSSVTDGTAVNIVYANEEDKIDVDLEIVEFNKAVFAYLEINFDHIDTESYSAYLTMLNGGTVYVNIDTTNLSSFAPMIFNCVAYDETGAISGDIEAYVKYTNGLLSISAALIKNTYSINDIGVLTKTEVPLSLSKIVGSANGIVIGGVE